MRRRRSILVLSLSVAGLLGACAWMVARASGRPPAGVDPALHAATNDDRYFERMGRPRPGDWLATHEEYGQSFEEFTEEVELSPALTPERRVIAITPIGPFDADERRVLDALGDFAAIWFDLPVRIEEGRPLPEAQETYRTRGAAGEKQYRTSALIWDIVAPAFPADAAVHIGATMVDVYPGPGWNFVFGQGSPAGKVGVYSLSRFFEDFYGKARTPQGNRLALNRGCALVVHELGHMFRLMHCKKYQCNMNGSNSLEETDRRPMALCPDCLKKLQWCIGFDLLDRYPKLAAFYDAHGLTDQAQWTRKRIERIERLAAR